MSITAEQREKRKGFLGSSDIPALVGVNEFQNLGDLWLEKTGRLQSRNGKKPAADMGTDLEPAVLNAFERRIGVKLMRDIPTLYREDIFCANLDAALPGEQKPIESVVEAKSTGYQEFWGDDVVDVPQSVLVQVQFQMWVADCGLAWIPVLFPEFKRFKLEVYQVERNDKLIEKIIAKARWFWSEHVEKDEPPPKTVPHLEILKQRRRQAEVVSLDTDAAEAWDFMQRMRDKRSAADRDVKEATRLALNFLGDAEAGRFPDGREAVYAEEGGPRTCDVDRLLVLAPEVYGQVVTKTTRRVARIKKSKLKGKGKGVSSI